MAEHRGSSPAEPLLLPFRDHFPKVHDTAWIAPGAAVIGDVEIGAEASIWFGSVLRGDVHSIRVGARTNLQDLVMLHGTGGQFPVLVGEDVTVGHRAVIHACTIGDGALVGMGSVILDGAEVGEGALVAAGALVSPGTRIPAGMVAMGVPARVVRELREDERKAEEERVARYMELAKEYAKGVAS